MTVGIDPTHSTTGEKNMPGRMELDERYTKEMVKAELPNFVERVNEMIKDHTIKNFSNLKPPVVHIGPGRKYIKLVSVSNNCGTSTSVYCFIRAADGAILKSASWKAPALNFTRGSIFSENLEVGPYGVRY
jgi:hypothetical protein